MRIDVTEEDITRGKKSQCWKCPIALAMNRTCGGEWRVDGFYARNGYQKVLFPVEAVDFQRNFDRGLKVAPFSFEVDL